MEPTAQFFESKNTTVRENIETLAETEVSFLIGSKYVFLHLLWSKTQLIYKLKPNKSGSL